MYHLILASSSKRRKEILQQVGVNFIIMPSSKEEKQEGDSVDEIVKNISSIKATDVEKHIVKDSIIIGADTVVVLDGKILGKPKDKKDAFDMIHSLQGRSHEVLTGVTIIIKTSGKVVKTISFVVSTKVKIHAMEDTMIYDYIATKEPMDKAGAYAIQGLFAINVEEIEGDYYNVVGLPIQKIYETLLNEGIDMRLI